MQALYMLHNVCQSYYAKSADWTKLVFGMVAVFILSYIGVTSKNKGISLVIPPQTLDFIVFYLFYCTAGDVNPVWPLQVIDYRECPTS